MPHSGKKTKYQISLTFAQLEALGEACDFYTRIIMGQLEDIVDLHLQSRAQIEKKYIEEGYGEDEEVEIDENLIEKKTEELRLAIGMKRMNYFSIHSIALKDKPKIVFDVFQKIQYQLGKIIPEIGHPIKASKQPLPIIKED